MHPPSDQAALAPHLLAHRAGLVRFVTARTGDAALAEDLVQDALLKALRAAPDFASDPGEDPDGERLAAWLYRVVRNAATDAYRRHRREGEALERFARELDAPATPEEEAELCACLGALLPTLKPEYAEALQAVDLGGEDADAAAERLGLSPENLRVRRYRARQQLRERLEQACRTCATHGCLDCSCSPSAS